jgi:hypothetical protein
MPLNPGDIRISVGYNPVNNYITPDVHLLKESTPLNEFELARVIDVLGINAYAGVVWVGQMAPANYFTDSNDNIIAGYLDAPFDTLNAGYVAALSRFGTPTAENPVVVVAIGAFTTETASIQLCSNYVNIIGIGENVVTGANGIPIFTSCNSFSGMFISGIDFVSIAAPILEISDIEPMPKGVTFANCGITNVGAASSDVVGLFDVHAPVSSPITLINCSINLNNYPLLYFDPYQNNSDIVMDVYNSTITINPTINTVFEGLTYIGAQLTSTEILVGVNGVSLFSCYVNTGQSYSAIYGLKIRNFGSPTGVFGEGTGPQSSTVYSLKLIDSLRYNTIQWEGIDSDAGLVINLAAFTDSSFTGSIKNSRWYKFSLNSNTAKLDTLTMVNITGDTQFTVVAVNPTVEFVNLTTLTPLQSITDTTAFITCVVPNGTVAGRLFNCNISYLLFYGGAVGQGVFCGQVIGGSSYGITRIVTMSNPTRQCVIRNHSFLKQDYYTNGVWTGATYPDLLFAGIIPNDSNIPMLIQGLQSQGYIDTEIINLTQIPNRYCYINDSSFEEHASSIPNSSIQGWFPSIPVANNPQSDQRIFISGGTRLPSQNTNLRDLGLRSVTYVNQIANRFGPLIIGDPTQPTIIQGNSFAVTNPRALRDALDVTYTTVYVRLPGGVTSTTITDPSYDSWSVLSMVADAGLDTTHLQNITANLPMMYTYIGNNTIQVDMPEPILSIDHFDFVIYSLNSNEDAAQPLPVTQLDVTQAGSVPIPIGVTQVIVTFSPQFTTVPIIIPGVAAPSGQPNITIELLSNSISYQGFTVSLPGGPVSVTGYYLNYIAASVQ